MVLFYEWVGRVKCPATLPHTVAEKMVNTPITRALMKWGHFDRAKHVLKVLLVSLSNNMSIDEV